VASKLKFNEARKDVQDQVHLRSVLQESIDRSALDAVEKTLKHAESIATLKEKIETVATQLSQYRNTSMETIRTLERERTDLEEIQKTNMARIADQQISLFATRNDLLVSKQESDLLKVQLSRLTVVLQDQKVVNEQNVKLALESCDVADVTQGTTRSAAGTEVIQTAALLAAHNSDEQRNRD
jgi:hypothetical protein